MDIGAIYLDLGSEYEEWSLDQLVRFELREITDGGWNTSKLSGFHNCTEEDLKLLGNGRVDGLGFDSGEHESQIQWFGYFYELMCLDNPQALYLNPDHTTSETSIYVWQCDQENSDITCAPPEVMESLTEANFRFNWFFPGKVYQPSRYDENMM